MSINAGLNQSADLHLEKLRQTFQRPFDPHPPQWLVDKLHEVQKTTDTLVESKLDVNTFCATLAAMGDVEKVLTVVEKGRRGFIWINKERTGSIFLDTNSTLNEMTSAVVAAIRMSDVHPKG